MQSMDQFSKLAAAVLAALIRDFCNKIGPQLPSGQPWPVGSIAIVTWRSGVRRPPYSIWR